jgi:glycerol-3-phosphate acyltransferase PlsY
MYLIFIPAVIGAYLLGSIPFGLLLARAHGKDLRKIGSGNIGATNVARALGRKWAYACFALDVLKGLIPMLATLTLFNKLSTHIQNERLHILVFWWLAVGCAAILGHVFPVYLKFKGGKGVATSFGVALGLWPYYTICAMIAIAVWAVVVSIWRYVSLASVIASVTFPLVLILLIVLKAGWEFTHLWPLVIAAMAIPLMVVIRHRENIKRLLSGTESKIRRKKEFN